MFKQSEREFLDIALRIASDLNGLQLKTSDIDIRFTRRNYENITEKANVLTTMLANNQIHPQLAFTHCGMFADPELAYKMSEEWQEKNRALAMEQANLTNGGEDVESTDQPGADGDH